MSILDQRLDPNSEKFLQNKVINDKTIQRYIIDNLGLKYDEKISFIKGKSYLNRIYPDVKIIKNNEILSLVEIKGSNINVTDYVRGIGQLFQYEYFSEKNITEKNTNDYYSENFKTLYLYPSEVTKNNDFNISNFKYPLSTKILQINLENQVIREFSDQQKIKFSDLNVNENLVAISEYYFRDNRIFELYIIIKVLDKFFKNNDNFLNRTDLELKYLRKYNTPNNNNWRNAFITLSGLGFLNSKNNLSEAGKDYSSYDYFEFCYLIYNSYIKEYVKELIPILIEKPSSSLSDINSMIKNKFENKEVLFLTESENRYLSSWLGIFRDDFGFISFKPRRTNRTVNYDPIGMSKTQFIMNMKKYSNAFEYLDRLITIH